MPIEINCDFVSKNLSAYYDKELDDDVYQKIQIHLRECITCRREFSYMAKMSYQLMKSFENVSISEINVDIDKAMQCHFVLEHLDEFVDKQLAKKESSQISEHLLNCTSCRYDYEKLKDIKKITRWYFSVFKMPSNIVNYKKVMQAPLQQKNKVVWTSVACLAGAVFLMLLSAMFFASDNINPPEVATQQETIKKIIQEQHEIQVSNIKAVEIN